MVDIISISNFPRFCCKAKWRALSTDSAKGPRSHLLKAKTHGRFPQWFFTLRRLLERSFQVDSPVVGWLRGVENVFGCLAIIILVCFISVSVYLHFRFVIANLTNYSIQISKKNISAFTWWTKPPSKIKSLKVTYWGSLACVPHLPGQWTWRRSGTITH